MRIEIDTTKEEAREHFSILFEGFGDGISGWDMADYQPAWDFLEKLRKAVEDA